MEIISNEKIEVVYKDSVRYYDSVVVVPVERYVDIVNKYDTLSLETSQAKAKCWVDSVWLRGEIENKDVVKYKYIDRYIDRWNDSIVYVDKKEFVKEVEQVKNPINGWLIGYAIISVLICFILVWRRFWK